MAVGKNKRLSKGKKGSKKKVVDPFSKKEWYDVKAPGMFTSRQVGKTLCTKTIGTKIAADSLKGRVFEVSLADLQDDEERAFRKVRLRVEDVQGKNCLTNFHVASSYLNTDYLADAQGMTFTTDKLRSLVRKWQTLIEAVSEVKTQDGYTMRLFCIAFTRRAPGQIRKTSYAQSSQIKEIRRKMFEIMQQEASSCDLKGLVAKFIPEAIGAKIESACQPIFPLQHVYIWKAKIVKYPKFDLSKLMDVHDDYEEDEGEAMARMDEEPTEEQPTEEPVPDEWGDS